MSDPTKPRPKSKRERGAIYGPRKLLTLRLDVELHRRLFEHLTELQMPANTFIVALIEEALRKSKK